MKPLWIQKHFQKDLLNAIVNTLKQNNHREIAQGIFSLYIAKKTSNKFKIFIKEKDIMQLFSADATIFFEVKF